MSRYYEVIGNYMYKNKSYSTVIKLKNFFYYVN